MKEMLCGLAIAAIYIVGFVAILWFLLGLLNLAIKWYKDAFNEIATIRMGKKRYHRICKHIFEVDAFLTEKYGEGDF